MWTTTESGSIGLYASRVTRSMVAVLVESVRFVLARIQCKTKFVVGAGGSPGRRRC